MHTVLIVGQTPPPYGGQSIMIERILQQQYSRLKLHHVRLSFSKEMDNIGKFQVAKIAHLVSTIFRIIIARFKFGCDVLYYPPAGPDKIPMFRDIIILICTRWLFKKTVFHFHAGGVSQLYERLSRLEQRLFKLAYHNPDGAILLSELNPRDDHQLNAKLSYIIPYGIEDQYQQSANSSANPIPTILFVGVLMESKGVLILLESLGLLQQRGIQFNAVFMGKFESNQFAEIVKARVIELGISDRVQFTGVLTGDAKWHTFSEADIFCFPTFFAAETFGLVVLEAMQFALPVVASDWRGVPSLIKESETGFVVPAKNSTRLADRLEQLCCNPELAKELGRNGRQRYLSEYSLTSFRDNIEAALVQIAEHQEHENQ